MPAGCIIVILSLQVSQLQGFLFMTSFVNMFLLVGASSRPDGYLWHIFMNCKGNHLKVSMLWDFFTLVICMYQVFHTLLGFRFWIVKSLSIASILVFVFNSIRRKNTFVNISGARYLIKLIIVILCLFLSKVFGSVLFIYFFNF